MAANYQRRKKHTGRNLFILLLLVMVGVFIWRQRFYTPKGDTQSPIEPSSPTASLNAERNITPDQPITPNPTPPDSTPILLPNASVQTEQTAPAPVVVMTRAQELFAEGRRAFADGDIIGARRKLTLAVESGLDPQENKQARDLLNQAADKWLLSRDMFDSDPHCSRHPVQTGELLVNLQKKYLVPYALLMTINNIKDASSLRAGQTIKAVQGPFRCVVERSKFRLTVYLGDVIVRSYTVTVGAPGQETPTGLWKVVLKQPNPAWTDPQTGKHYLPDDPDNPLGEHWIALEGIEGDAVGRKGFGIHGTTKPEAIGSAASHGCIRLHNGQAEEVYNMLLEGQSMVLVVE